MMMNPTTVLFRSGGRGTGPASPVTSPNSTVKPTSTLPVLNRRRRLGGRLSDVIGRRGHHTPGGERKSFGIFSSFSSHNEVDIR